MRNSFKGFINSKLLIGGAALSIVFSSGFTYPNGAKLATQVKIGESTVGVVENIESAQEIINRHIEIEKSKVGEALKIEPVAFESIMAKEEEILDNSQFEKIVETELDIYTKGYSINVNGNPIVNLSSEKDAQQVLENIKNKYMSTQENIKTLEVNFKENVEVTEKEVSNRELVSIEEAERILSGVDSANKVYKTTKIDTLKNISEELNIPLNILENANPEFKGTGIPNGTELRIPVNNENLTIVTKEEITYVEPIIKEVKKIESDKYYKGEEVVEQKGENGLLEYKAVTVKENGIKTTNEIKEKNLLKESVEEIIAVGTSEKPATGTFTNPTVGKLTSRFGPRWGRFHYGIDVANSVGTNIIAADGGKVVFAGMKSTYGNLVEIDHENGFITRYAHLNTIDVKQGDIVTKGQKIAGLGNTGRSTGPHLHFEVLKNNTNEDPLIYVNY